MRFTRIPLNSDECETVILHHQGKPNLKAHPRGIEITLQLPNHNETGKVSTPYQESKYVYYLHYQCCGRRALAGSQ